MSDVRDFRNGLALIKAALSKPTPEQAIHESLYHCGKYIDFCNLMFDEIWPLLRAEIVHDFLFRNVPTPILEHTALVHSTPWDWDIQPCESCGKMVGTPVMKNKRAWLGNKYCCACESKLLSQAS